MKAFFTKNKRRWISLVFCFFSFSLASILQADETGASIDSLSSSLQQVADINSKTDPALVMRAFANIPPSAYQQMKPELLVNVSYSAAVTANFDLAFQLTDILLAQATALDDQLLIGQAHYNRGAAFAISGNHDLALDSLLLALSSFENSQDQKEIARIKGSLALIYVEIGEFQLAKPYFDESLKAHRANNDSVSLAMVLQNQAFMKVLLGEFESAKQDLLESLTLAKSQGLKSIIAVIYKNLGKTETEQGNKALAASYFEQALVETQNNQFEFQQSEILREFAQLNLLNAEFDNAKAKLDQSLLIGRKYGLIKQISSSYLLLAKIHSDLGEFKEAYVAHKMAAESAEKMGKSHIAANLSRLERYTTSLKQQNQRLVLEKEKKIATLAAEREHILRNFFIAVAGIAILLAIYVIRRLILSRQQVSLFEKQSKIDSLTGVWNRRAGEAQLLRLCARDTLSLKVFSIAMLDIDHFKRVNDQFGHDVGDRVIIAICNVIEDNLRPSDMLCRWGGEEFVIILEGTKAAKSFDICDRIRERIEKTEIEHIGNMTVSIGISAFENDDIYDLLKRGDQAMYQAKHLGRNQVVVKNKVSEKYTTKQTIEDSQNVKEVERSEIA